MSRIGKQPITVASGVTVTPSNQGDMTRIRVEGPKGKLESAFRSEISIDVSGGKVVVTRPNDLALSRADPGTVRALIANMVRGVTEGFSRRLEIIGVGYNAKLEGKSLVLAIGFCHPVKLPIPAGLTVECPTPTSIIVRGADKQGVGEFAAKVRRVRPPEPYKGKGIRYSDEVVIRKQGKAFGSGD